MYTENKLELNARQSEYAFMYKQKLDKLWMDFQKNHV